MNFFIREMKFLLQGLNLVLVIRLLYLHLNKILHQFKRFLFKVCLWAF